MPQAEDRLAAIQIQGPIVQPRRRARHPALAHQRVERAQQCDIQAADITGGHISYRYVGIDRHQCCFSFDTLKRNSERYPCIPIAAV
jgi:hypothetical protein